MNPRNVLALALVALTISGASAQTPTSSPEETVNVLVRALETSDIDLLMSTFDESATAFMPSALVPSRRSGKAAIREAFESFFKSAPPGAGPLTITPRDMETQRMGDVAIVTFHLGQVPAKPPQGPFLLSRRTIVLRRVGTRWLVVHLHASSVRN